MLLLKPLQPTIRSPYVRKIFPIKEVLSLQGRDSGLRALTKKKKKTTTPRLAYFSRAAVWLCEENKIKEKGKACSAEPQVTAGPGPARPSGGAALGRTPRPVCPFPRDVPQRRDRVSPGPLQRCSCCRPAPTLGAPLCTPPPCTPGAPTGAPSASLPSLSPRRSQSPKFPPGSPMAPHPAELPPAPLYPAPPSAPPRPGPPLGAPAAGRARPLPAAPRCPAPPRGRPGAGAGAGRGRRGRAFPSPPPGAGRAAHRGGRGAGARPLPPSPPSARLPVGAGTRRMPATPPAPAVAGAGAGSWGGGHRSGAFVWAAGGVSRRPQARRGQAAPGASTPGPPCPGSSCDAGKSAASERRGSPGCPHSFRGDGRRLPPPVRGASARGTARGARGGRTDRHRAGTLCQGRKQFLLLLCRFCSGLCRFPFLAG